ncbi:MAG TPA: ribosomal protein S18-alanine N-acetyltransferase [Nitrososphaeraceae archaeon]|nr:ribosomal protein S18-alanine N-acetyltransferase [Nitrososphaeraceae archaeon]
MIRLNNLFSSLCVNLQSALRKIGDCVIRHCSPSDLPSVVEINTVSLPEHYSDYFFESILKELPESFIVAETNQKIVGYIMCKIEFGFSNFRRLGFVKKGHVVSVAVLQEHRGKGIGRSLLVEAINGLAGRKCDEIYLEVRASNSLAIKMYQSIGFLIKSRLHSYYRDGEDAYLMAFEFDQ